MKDWNLIEKIGAVIAVVAIVGGIAFYAQKGIEGSSAFVPPITPSGIVYVSDGPEASDGNDGFYKATPVRTLKRAFKIVGQINASEATVSVLGTSYEVLRSDAEMGVIDVNEGSIMGQGKEVVYLSSDSDPIDMNKLSLYGEDDGQNGAIQISLNNNFGKFILQGFDIDNIELTVESGQNARILVRHVIVGGYKEVIDKTGPSSLREGFNIGRMKVVATGSSEVVIEKSIFYSSIDAGINARPIPSLQLNPASNGLISVINNQFGLPDYQSVYRSNTEEHEMEEIAVSPRSVGIDTSANNIKIVENRFLTFGNTEFHPNNLLIQAIRLNSSDVGGATLLSAVTGNDFTDFVGLQIVSQIYRKNSPQDVAIYDNYVKT